MIGRAAGGLLTLLLLSGRVVATGLEYPDVHKVPRVLGMGGADVAVGGHPGALFTNVAGLATMAEGWRVVPLTLTVASSRRTEAFGRQLLDALDIDEIDPQREALIEVLREYRGQNLHGEGVVLPGVFRRAGSLALGLSWLGAVKLDGRSHQGFGDGGLLDVDARTLAGPVAGAAYTHGRLRVGLALKHLRRNRVSRTYSIRELIEMTREGRSISDDRQAGRDFGFDIGLQYELAPQGRLQPQFGLVVSNVGDMDFGVAGEIPQTVTVGIALRPPVAANIAGLVFSVEYFDLLHRLPQDRSFRKRLRTGAEWQLWRRPRSSLALSAGLYQGAPSAGLDWRLRWFRIGLSSYAEEQGAYPGQDRDRRYSLSLGFEL